jgi:hypothetical protein
MSHSWPREGIRTMGGMVRAFNMKTPTLFALP